MMKTLLKPLARYLARAVVDGIQPILQQMESRLMTKLDDLNAAVAALAADIDTEIAALAAAHADDDTAGVEAAVSNLQALSAKLKASVVSVTPPVTPPAPTQPPAA